MLFPQSPGGYY
eukprot:gene9958-biopygen6477